MVSSSYLNSVERFKDVHTQYCFYVDVQDRDLAKSISNRIQDLGLREEVFLTSSVTHVVRDISSNNRSGAVQRRGGARAACPAARSTARQRTRADAMLERVRGQHTQPPEPQPSGDRVVLSVNQAIILLNNIYDSIYGDIGSKSKPYVKLFTKHYIKVEFLDKPSRPLYQEFDEWPDVSLEPIQKPNPYVYKRKCEKKMTRKSRPRLKDREDKESKAGYCEICNIDYPDAAEHQRSLHHMTFVRDHTNFLSLDTLIGAGTDVSSFLDKATPLNGERRSLRKMCNGDLDAGHTRSKRSNRSQTPDSQLNISNHSPKRVNGGIDDERKHNTRCSKRSSEYPTPDERQYYKVVGVSTKLRSSGGFAAKRNSPPPTCNGGSKPLVVKFRKVRRSELSVLSDEAEQFMFPKRASSTSSTSSNEGDHEEKSPPHPPLTLERRRLARPLALKEESSEEDSWPEDKRRKKRKAPTVVKRRPTRTTPLVKSSPEEPPPEPTPEPVTEPPPAEEVANPLREDPGNRCLKWEDGKLKYTPAVEQLEFAFEWVPHSEPWYATFKRQDEDKPVTKSVPNLFALYTKSPKLPYEIGQLPPLKPNCCPLSDLVKREDKPGPSRSYGTRGNKRQKIRKRTAAALIAMEAHPRKSPREHASTLAILGSVGLLHRRRHADDNKSTASEDTVSETQSNTKVEPVKTETQQASERLQQFFSEVFEDAAEYEVPDDMLEGEAAVIAATNAPDVVNLVSECESCEMIRDEIVSARASRRGHKVKKKNRTGWPNKKRLVKKGSRAGSRDPDAKEEDAAVERSSAELPETADESTRDGSTSGTEESGAAAEPDGDSLGSEAERAPAAAADDRDAKDDKSSLGSDDRPLRLDVKLLLRPEDEPKAEGKPEPEPEKRGSRSSASEAEEREERAPRGGRKRRGAAAAVGGWLQPVVRVARVDPAAAAARRLRSAGRGRPARFR